MDKRPVEATIPYAGKVERSGAQLTPHTMAFPSAMMSLKVLLGLEHRTEIIQAHGTQWREDLDYHDYAAISGEGFRFFFDTAEYFRFDMPEGNAPVFDCFLTIGLPARLVTTKKYGIAQCRSAVLDALADGRPALILGHGKEEYVLLATGYQENGDTLIAWMFSPGRDLTNKSFAVEDNQFIRDWSEGMDAVIVVTGAPGEEEADLPAIYRRSLERGTKALLNPQGHPYGIKTASYYQDWIDFLSDEVNWQEPLNGRPHIDPEIWDLAERRYYLGGFMHRCAGRLNLPSLHSAGDLCDEIHGKMWEINALCDGEEGQEKLRKPHTRKQIVQILMEVRQKDHKVAQIIKNALQK